MNDFTFGKEVVARCSAALCGETLRELWHGFCFASGFITLLPSAETEFVIGEICPAPLPQGKKYSITVAESGAAVIAENDADLMQGILELLSGIKAKELGENVMFSIASGIRQDDADIAVRMIHFCVFPETSYEFMIKSIRMCGVLHYTHIVLEFWGMLQFDCMKELSWPDAFSKAQAKALVDEIRLLGMEPIPMFNHLGHASACRIASGKHVVLDQNPSLALYFSEDGWNWNIDAPCVRELMKNIRHELYKVFGKCEYFHLGIDECYLYGSEYALTESLAEYLNLICGQVLEEGCRPIIWGDMWLSHQRMGTVRQEYTCNCKDTRIADKILGTLDKRVIIADWQYHKKEGTMVTTPYFQALGFDTLCCPWEGNGNVRACVDTIRENNGFGVMQTTWHTLNRGFQYVYACAKWCERGRSESVMDNHFTRPAAAMLWRKVYPHFTGYENCGWMKHQINLSE